MLNEDSEKRQKLIAPMSKDEFYSTVGKEAVYKKIEDEKTRNDLKEFYGDEYQDMIFKEAVKLTDFPTRPSYILSKIYLIPPNHI